MSPIDSLAQFFEKFPGIGPRQAKRFVQYLLQTSPTVRTELAELIKKLGVTTGQCKRCFRWFVKEGIQKDECTICANSRRDQTLLFVVEKDADIDNVEKSGFTGLYFVLGGTVPLAAEEPAKFVRIRELVKRAEAGSLKEVILGLSATTEGDHTRLILQERLLSLADVYKFKLSSLGRGLSTGSELEYADPDTIASALNSRN